MPTWRGPGTMIKQDGQQILIKPGSTYVRVHQRNVQRKNIDKMISDDSPSSDKTWAQKYQKVKQISLIV